MYFYLTAVRPGNRPDGRVPSDNCGRETEAAATVRAAVPVHKSALHEYISVTAAADADTCRDPDQAGSVRDAAQPDISAEGVHRDDPDAAAEVSAVPDAVSGDAAAEVSAVPDAVLGDAVAEAAMDDTAARKDSRNKSPENVPDRSRSGMSGKPAAP